MQATITSTQTVTVINKPRDNDKKTTKKKTINVRTVAVLVLLVFVSLYVSIAVLLRYSVQVQSYVVYVNFLRLPLFGDLTKPAEFGLRNTINFDLIQYDGCPVSTWHILPDTYHHDNLTDPREYISALSDGATIILYLHGNTGTRARSNRIKVYQELAKRGYHVITFDYRGFGDSTCLPSERGLMEDAMLEWNWIQVHAPKSRVFIWGHSLGSAAATHLAEELWHKRSVYPKGIILDAPFPTIVEAAVNHPFGIPYWPVMSLFRYFVVESFQDVFDSEAHLKHIPFPLLIAHGHNDIIIPFNLGRRMYETVTEEGTKNPFLSRKVYFIDCGMAGHNSNLQSPELQLALSHFIDNPQ